MKAIHLRNTIAQAICLALFPLAGLAQTTGGDAQPADTQTLERIEVTGSRIKRTEVEGVDPVQVLTAADIQHEGFANVYDALSNLTVNTGVFVGEEQTNNFNANAQALNLRGFGPGYTLVLINGRRLPALPKPSDAVGGNVTNLAMIPTSAVERVEILTSGASAIYGSDAVAGVVNVILKDHIDETTLTYRYGDTVHGGGRSDRATVTSGFTHGDTRLTWGLELDRREPIRGDQRSWFDSPERSPDPNYRGLSQVMSFWDRADGGWGLLDLTSRCQALGYQPVRPGWAGKGSENYCGDNDFNTYTIRNKRERVSGFANLTHSFGDHEFYATLLATHSKADAGLYRYSWSVDYEVVDDLHAADPQVLGERHVFRSFRDFEFPGGQQRFNENTQMLVTGLRGRLGDFDYSLNYNVGRYGYKDSVRRLDDEAMLALVFGKKGVDWTFPWQDSRWVRVGTDRLDGRWLPNGSLDLFGPLKPDQFQSALHTSVGDGRSTSQSVSADLSGSLFELPAGPLGFAAVAEFDRDTYRFLTDQDTVDGKVFGWSGIRGHGSRNRSALGSEFAIPLLKADSGFGQWEAKLAARYDDYDDASDVGGAFTYQAGLSWRPTDWLMFRASRATSFRAPDMHVMFAERSSSYTSGTDYLACVNKEGLARGQSWQRCGDKYGTGSIRQYSEGDPHLHEESGYTNTIGMVAQLGSHHSFTLDWYRIQLEDQIGLINADTTLRYAAECMLGFDAQGHDVDRNSPKCRTMLARVARGGPNDGVTSVITSPFNTGMYRQDGIDFTWSSVFPTDRWGRFTARFSYTHVLKTLNRYLPEDPVENIRDKPWNNNFRTRSALTLGWDYRRFSGYVHINQLGSSPVRWADTYKRVGSWSTVNLSTNYRVTDALSLGLTVTNLFDRTPPGDYSEKWWPYADVSKYNPVGTEYFFNVEYKF